MLGRSVLRELSTNPSMTMTIMGTGYSRIAAPLIKLDLLDSEAVKEIMHSFKPDVLIHCAAERKPDNVDRDKEKARKLNISSTKLLAECCKDLNTFMVYISTDYVFDGGIHTGAYPPYSTEAKTSPVNEYGLTKLGGEIEVANCCEKSLILRVPVLYALDCESLDESASLVVAKSLNSKEPTKVDNWGIRFPTLVDDVSRCIKMILDSIDHVSLDRRIVHFSSPERCTKYELAKMMADCLNVSSSHISPDSESPKGAPRPKNTQLDCSATWELLKIEKFEFTPLQNGIAKALEPFQSSFQ